MRRTNSSASRAPHSRSIPESSHSIDSGPAYPIWLSALISASKSTPPRPGETKSQPAAAIAKVKMAAENAPAPVKRKPRILDVDVLDPLPNSIANSAGIEQLRQEVTRVEVDPKRAVTAKRVEQLGVVTKS